MKEILVLKGVYFSAGRRPVLKSIDLELLEGQRLVLIGPSGCGKTTLLRLIAGFEAPEAGTISLYGREASLPGRIVIPPEERNIGFVFQDLALWPHMSVYGNLEFGLKARGVPKGIRRERIRELLHITNLDGLEDRRPSALSGGQQQRVALARALVMRPRLLLMDEPLSSLDQELKEGMIEKIIELQEMLGFGMIHVTHDMHEAERLGQRIMALKGGRLNSTD